MGVFDRLTGWDKREAAIRKELKQEIQATTTKAVKSETQKIEKSLVQLNDSLYKATGEGMIIGSSTSKGLKRYQFDPVTTNRGIYSRKKPDSAISFPVLRKFATQHEISRACINARKRQINGLEWEIVPVDTEDTKKYDAQIKQLKEFFVGIGGEGNRYRKFISRVIEDLLVLDAVALEKVRTRGNQLFTLLPIDAATIRLRVDETGGTPLPPEIAYKQVIRGEVVAEMTTDEMIYDMMNPRSESPYGLAPLESLMIIVSSSLKAGMFNLGYLTDGNIPEGVFTMPEGWTPQMIQDFQENWDAVIAGDTAAMAKLRFMPPGEYTQTKKPTDMAFDKFNDWLMKVTCSLFDVQPTEIGFAPETGLGGKGFSDGQQDATMRKGMRPLAHFIEEIFNRVIAEDFGMPELCFSYVGLDDQKDAKAEAEVQQIQVASGLRTIDEIRTDEGLAPLPDGQGARPFVTMGNPTFLDQPEPVEPVVETTTPTNEEKPGEADVPDAEEQAEDVNGNMKPTTKAEDIHVQLVTELRTFRKYAINRAKAGQTLRAFKSDVLPAEAVEELNKRLQEATDVDMIKGIFREYMQDYQIDFLANVQQLRTELSKAMTAEALT